MNTQQGYRSGLDKSSKKHICPECGKKSFTYYTDFETGEYLPEKYGYCDRSDKCGYQLNPYNDGYFKKHFSEKNVFFRPSLTSLASPLQKIHFDYQTLKNTQGNERLEKNIFIQNFLNGKYPMDPGEVQRMAGLYRLGTIINGNRAGGCCFPFIDVNRNVRAVQVKQFDENNHTVSTDFLHSIIKRHNERKGIPAPPWIEEYGKQEKKITCLFGEHLLPKYPNNPIALVEAPKTAIIGTLYFGLPDDESNYIWLAVYNKSSFSRDKLEVLRGRRVAVFPDLSADGGTFEEWRHKAESFGHSFFFSDMLERGATPEEKQKGLDLADYLTRFDWRLFRKESKPERVPETPIMKIQLSPAIVSDYKPITKWAYAPYKRPVTQNWADEIEELQAFFEGVDLKNEIRLDSFSRITNPKKYIESNLSGAETYNGKERFRPFLNRLYELKRHLNN